MRNLICALACVIGLAACGSNELYNGGYPSAEEVREAWNEARGGAAELYVPEGWEGRSGQSYDAAIGNKGRLFYDEATGQLSVSPGRAGTAQTFDWLFYSISRLAEPKLSDEERQLALRGAYSGGVVSPSGDFVYGCTSIDGNNFSTCFVQPK